MIQQIVHGFSLKMKQLRNLKKLEETRKLTTVQCENYTVGCLLDYDYLKNYYRLTAVDLSRQKELDADPKQFNK